MSEGEGDSRALPELVNRWLRRRNLHLHFSADPHTILAKAGDLLFHTHDRTRRLGIERYVEIALRHEPDAVLVVLDADDACEARGRAGLPTVGPELQQRAETTSPSVPVGVVVANREFEAWLLADFPALRQRGVFPANVRLDEVLWRNPESRRDCRTPLRRLLGRPYVEAIDQFNLVQQVSLGRRMTRVSASFRKLVSVLKRLTALVRRSYDRRS